MRAGPKGVHIRGSAVQLQIAANLPPEIGRQLTNVCTVRFGTKELTIAYMSFELLTALLISTGGKFAAICCKAHTVYIRIKAGY